jgi:hypothetical protein
MFQIFGPFSGHFWENSATDLYGRLNATKPLKKKKNYSAPLELCGRKFGELGTLPAAPRQ